MSPLQREALWALVIISCAALFWYSFENMDSAQGAMAGLVAGGLLAYFSWRAIRDDAFMLRLIRGPRTPVQPSDKVDNDTSYGSPRFGLRTLLLLGVLMMIFSIMTLIGI